MEWCSQELITSPYKYKLCVGEEDLVVNLKELELPFNEWSEVMQAEACCVFMNTTSGPICLVYLSPMPDMSDEGIVSVIAHESVHIWQRVREALSEEFPSDEFEAYSIQKIFANLLAQYRLITKNLNAKKKISTRGISKVTKNKQKGN